MTNKTSLMAFLGILLTWSMVLLSNPALARESLSPQFIELPLSPSASFTVAQGSTNLQPTPEPFYAILGHGVNPVPAQVLECSGSVSFSGNTSWLDIQQTVSCSPVPTAPYGAEFEVIAYEVRVNPAMVASLPAGQYTASYTTVSSLRYISGFDGEQVSDFATETGSFSLTVTGGPPPPTATITSPSGNVTILVGETISLVGTGSSDNPNAQLTYAWNLGDGRTAGGSVVAVNYPNPGVYTVTLTVTDQTSGLAGSDSRIITVAAADPGPAPTGPVDFSGRITALDGTPLCAMVLINGEFMFSCDPVGQYALQQVPRDAAGQTTVFAFVDGFAPFARILTPPGTSQAFDIRMARAGADSQQIQVFVDDLEPLPGNRAWILGFVANVELTGLCTMVLANGEHMFSCIEDFTGWFYLNMPLAEDRTLTLFSFADGFAPFRASSNPLPQPPTPQRLTSGVPVTGLSDEERSLRYFSIDVPTPNTDLRITLSGGSGDADLYVRFGTFPTRLEFDCRPFIDGNEEVCTFIDAQPGTYFVMLRGWTDYAGVTLQANIGSGFDPDPDPGPTPSPIPGGDGK